MPSTTKFLSTEEINRHLKNLSADNQEYAEFNKRIVNTAKIVLGVRVPDLRKFAKTLAKNSTPAHLANYLRTLDKNIYEQVLLAGLLINCSNLTDGEAIKLAKQYLKLIDSWAEVDIFASKRQKFDEKLWWNFAVESLDSSHEFTVRYGVVEMMANFLDDKYIEKVFQQLRTVKHDGYYVRMSMAWLYATAAVKYCDRTLEELRTSDISAWTKKKALTKMIESYQFSEEQKEQIRTRRASANKPRVERSSFC